jgi:predicted RNA-binding Zn-ribbon protein involved in translation (DUF1610 family)
LTRCRHRKLVLLPAEKKRLRCRRCHLTIKPEDLDAGYCPECYERDGTRSEDFEEVGAEEDGAARYRCESCGAIIEADPGGR